MRVLGSNPSRRVITMNVYAISLGCPRNLVDTEMMLGQLLETGHTIVSEAAEADCVVVNTCSFTGPATSESVDAILEMAHWKKQDEGRMLIVTGCLPERYRADLFKCLPEVDAFVGTGAFHHIADVIGGKSPESRMLLPSPLTRPISGQDLARLQTTPNHLSYLKIAEGCSGHCTYCIIPKLRGPYRSRPMEEILSEARALAESGTKELILIAQNTSAYGCDWHQGHRLEDLLGQLSRISQFRWIRMLYGHPDYITDKLLETIANHRRICPYFDVPVQHISNAILRKMARGHDSKKLFTLFEHIRDKVPGAVLRTTLMVGFPGETEKDFQGLLDFIERVRFDHIGAFMYSDGKDLPSSRLGGHIVKEVKQQRFECLMTKQALISRQNNEKYVGQVLDAIIESPVEPAQQRLVARAAFQAPDIDGIIHIEKGTAQPGTFARVYITQASDYDLNGQIVS